MISPGDDEVIGVVEKVATTMMSASRPSYELHDSVPRCISNGTHYVIEHMLARRLYQGSLLSSKVACCYTNSQNCYKMVGNKCTLLSNYYVLLGKNLNK
jgi:hypothetical protein